MSSHVTVSLHLEAVKEREFELLTVKQLREVERKLVAKPTYGKPLTGPLSGLRSLRAGDLRVVYTIVSDSEVRIIAIGKRRDSEVYTTVAGRVS